MQLVRSYVRLVTRKDYVLHRGSNNSPFLLYFSEIIPGVTGNRKFMYVNIYEDIERPISLL